MVLDQYRHEVLGGVILPFFDSFEERERRPLRQIIRSGHHCAVASDVPSFARTHTRQSTVKRLAWVGQLLFVERDFAVVQHDRHRFDHVSL